MSEALDVFIEGLETVGDLGVGESFYIFVMVIMRIFFVDVEDISCTPCSCKKQ